MIALDRQLPNAIEAERAILGAMLLDSHEAGSVCRQHLTADHFYKPAHRVVFEQIVAALDATGECDAVMLTHRLRESGKLDDAGGAACLSDLVMQCPSVRLLDQWLDLVVAAYKRRQAITFGTELVNDAFGGTGDPSPWLAERAHSLCLLGESSKAPTQPAGAITTAVAKVLADRWHNEHAITGEPTGFADLDNILHGLRPGHLVVAAGHRSVGKTALACNIAAHATAKDKQVLVFTLEQVREEIIERMVQIRAGVDLSRFNQKFMDISQHAAVERAVEEIESWPLLVNDRAGQTAPAIAAEARRQSARAPLSLVVVDYLQLVAWPSRAETGAVAIGENCRIMKAMAKECGCPVLLLSQLNRADLTAGSRPQLHHLRGSGEIEEAADVVLLLSGKLTAEELPGEYGQLSAAEIDRLVLVDVAKHRNGPTGLVFLRFDKPTLCFQNLAHTSHHHEGNS